MHMQGNEIAEMRERLRNSGSSTLTRVEQAKLVREVELLRWLTMLLYKTIIKIALGKTTGAKALEVLKSRVIQHHEEWFADLDIEPEYRMPE